jgi:hypothetical protein
LIIGKHIIISSGYRSPEFNKKIEGDPYSQHTKGQTADFNISDLSIDKVISTIIENRLPFDQLINEFGSWVHVLHSPNLRNQVLLARRKNGKTVYVPFS